MSGVAGIVQLMLGRRRLAAGESEVGESAAPAVDAGSRDRTLPRWLDPSVAAARRPDLRSAVVPDRGAAVAPARDPMVFVTPGDELGGLHYVRYDGVPLLDRPDDVLGWTMLELNGGDEVNVLERAEIWARVRTPNNLVGWIPGMTLAAGSGHPADGLADAPAAGDLDLPAMVEEEPIALEALLEAVAARRLALREPPPQAVPASPRRRTRKPKAEAATAEAPPTSTRRRVQPKAMPAEET